MSIRESRLNGKSKLAAVPGALHSMLHRHTTAGDAYSAFHAVFKLHSTRIFRLLGLDLASAQWQLPLSSAQHLADRRFSVLGIHITIHLDEICPCRGPGKGVGTT